MLTCQATMGVVNVAIEVHNRQVFADVAILRIAHGRSALGSDADITIVFCMAEMSHNILCQRTATTGKFP